MTQLQRQLDAARKSYEAVGYPGDLATDIGVTRKGIRPAWYIGALAGAAMAAAVMIAVWPTSPVTTGSKPPVEVAVKAPVEEPKISQARVEPTPKMVDPVGAESVAESGSNGTVAATALTIVPPSFSITPPSMPSIPSWGALMSMSTTEETSTTRESL